MKATTTDPVRSATMRAVKSKDTTPEMKVRRLVHGLGCRYRLHRKDLPGKPDLVFGSRRKVIMVNGCFWHGHDCARGARQPKSNSDYWKPKIGRNVARDATNLAALQDAGWDVLTIWECETKAADRPALEKRLREFLTAA
ncbi:very short patch repair endonuclease [Gemmobacter aquaticus]|uniref:Very short patch repair endonuclease n=1 Tax=Gemmobacter aquaticus TaxID=490185 RepID=A0A918DDZ6_9RHOB|nr:very short patch repair endonuclease [Gemmobacter aquaticus]GGO38607.1 very short patch repair endonuclease [Gemmobacter aquaticus]